jgi:Ohr subfamily peroxiredoxin
MTEIYQTRVTSIGGRSGTVRSDDGILDLPLALPKELGGKGGATNPEQLFAAGYAACFETAIIHVMHRQRNRVRDDAIEVMATVGLADNGQGGFALEVALNVAITGLDQAKAEETVQAARLVCPYSNAVMGNVDVKINVSTR